MPFDPDTFVPTVHDQRKNAVRLARDAIARATRDAYRAEQLEELDGLPVTTLTQELYKVGLLELVRISTTAEHVSEDADGNESRRPDYNTRLRALECLMDLRIREGELLLKAGEQSAATSGGSKFVEARVVTEDDLAKLEAMHREAEASLHTEG